MDMVGFIGLGRMGLPMASMAEETFIQAINKGRAKKASIISFTVPEERAGVQVRLPEELQ